MTRRWRCAILRRPTCSRRQANEQQAEINLGYTNVTAPFDGVVSARQVSIGQLVGANSATVLSTIVQIDPIYVNFNVSERDVLAVPCRTRPYRPHLRRFAGHPDRDSGCRPRAAIRTKASSTTWRRPSTPRPERSPPAQSWKIPIGFCCPVISCACADRSGRKLLCWCPMSRSAAIRAGRYVLIVNKDNVVEQRKVEPGQLIGELRVIEKGLTKDDRVVIGGIMRAIPGQKVEPELRTLAAANQ